MQHVILVHGAFYNGAVWDKLVPLIAAPNRVLHCPTLTGAGGNNLSPNIGLSTHVQDIKNLVDEIAKDRDAEIVLIGHRYSGMVITEVAKQMPDKIGHLVYIDSPVPLSTESLMDTIGGMDKQLEIVDSWKARTSLADLGLERASDVAWAEKHVFAQSLACFTEKTSATAVGSSIQQTYILCSLPSKFRVSQAARVKKMGGQVRQIQTSYSAMVTHPEVLAAEIRAIL
jgi:pimeloyl-ACP methyl ester carboxylesterase